MTSTSSSDSPAVHTWHQAVLAATRWLRAQGYPDAVPVPGGAETGVDIRATGALALVCHSDKAIRRDQIQPLVAARGKDPSIALFAFTSSRFELPAVTLADSRGVRLLSYDADGHVSRFDYDASLRAAGAAGSPAGLIPAASEAILRFAPLGVGIFMLLAAGIQFLALARGSGGSWGGALTSLGLGAALLLGWVAWRRRQRARTSADDGARPPS